MHVYARRGLLAGTATLAAGSLAAATLLRKPPGPVLLTPVADGGETTPQGMDRLARIEPATPPPAISFQDADGARHTLGEFAGRGVVLNIWATWCAPCVAELPSLAALAARAATHGVVVLPLSLDRGGTATVRAFYASHGIDGLGVWNDAEGAAGRLLGIRGVPTTFILDRQGREIARLEGSADWGSDAALTTIAGLVG